MFDLGEVVVITLLTAILILLALYVLVWLRDRRTSLLKDPRDQTGHRLQGLMRGMTQSHTVSVTQIDGQQQIMVDGVRYTHPDQIRDPRVRGEVRQVIDLVRRQKGELSPLADHEVRIKWLGEADDRRRHQQAEAFVTDQGESFAIEVDGRTYHALAEIRDPEVREGVRLLAEQARRLTSEEGLRLGRASIAFDLEIQIEGQKYYDVDDIPDPELREEVRAILMESDQAGGVEEVKVIQIGGKTYQHIDEIPDPMVRQEMRHLLSQAQHMDEEGER